MGIGLIQKEYSRRTVSNTHLDLEFLPRYRKRTGNWTCLGFNLSLTVRYLTSTSRDQRIPMCKLLLHRFPNRSKLSNRLSLALPSSLLWWNQSWWLTWLISFCLLHPKLRPVFRVRELKALNILMSTALKSWSCFWWSFVMFFLIFRIGRKTFQCATS